MYHRDRGRKTAVWFLVDICGFHLLLNATTDARAKGVLHGATHHEYHSVNAGLQRIMNRVVHDQLATGSNWIQLLESPIASAQTGSEDQQSRWSHPSISAIDWPSKGKCSTKITGTFSLGG